MPADGFPYQRVADGVGATSKADISVGEQIPSENELAEAYGASRNVVRRALAILRIEGLITPDRGAGQSSGQGVGSG